MNGGMVFIKRARNYGSNSGKCKTGEIVVKNKYKSWKM
jgi:hypothetical protein